MQDFSGRADLIVAVGFLPLILLAVVLVFALIGARATNRWIRRGFKLLVWICGLGLAAGAIGLAVAGL
ncbi:hypothetical protein [Caulobacter rhizosphaerae]|jgi:hypothetical protein|uniref:Uncharacterized protein n=1 Tax=Caulobacter rhizosphaerae TaxID=2010972 RepID=A0ABU1MVE2_9CAUL|nr:hypothetical protein [Caulobacter rhizosphaerae]MDR6530002.1 hypothetical protein [Caulobacter rhizosphaerae]GGL45263.1 hypothetical protein GCM10010983_48210 [Caulobacter rhizosphaerae]